MDFDLSRLDPRNFEQLAQSLAQHEIGPSVTLFGDGPDGGREASWEAVPASNAYGDHWAGYGVLQAKARINPGTDVASNLRWIKSQVTSEAKRWRESKESRATPNHYLLVTNVSLSASQGGGIDQLATHLTEQFLAAGHSIERVTIWTQQELRALIENNDSVRNAYAAWILPGDIMYRLYEDLESREAQFVAGLHLHAANSLTKDVQLKLNQTGTVRDQPIGLAQVFIDVPYDYATASFVDPGNDGQLPTGIAEHLLQVADRAPHLDPKPKMHRKKRIAVVGGPGQGKSTITQFLAQLYRASFLLASGSPVTPEVQEAVDLLHRRAEDIELPLPSAHRWPIRVVLPDLADALSSGTSQSVLHHIASEINTRASINATTSDLLRWLQSYPWIVLFDGLDEVPSSANRNQLLEALRDFYAAADSVGADLVTIATTRPQGYDGEFGEIQHIELTPLDQRVALRFADTFLDARNGPNSEWNERTKSLLRQAIEQPATERLFESPLQATILAILIERLGHAPSDRWRLFSAYYQVITQREQEKLGELASLLQTYASEIDYLHRAVGRLLQDRGEGEGGARGILSRSELEQIIETRLLDLGHDKPTSIRLARDFMRLATERLVFLAMLTAETAGFEIRSMQEFMAAEQITQDFSDEETFGQLQSLASRPYWSNVLRFAAGRIFGQREILKPIVLQICQGLEAETDISMVTRGQVLALDILNDGVVDTQPRYAIPLAEHASKLLRGPSETRIEDLARVTSPAGRSRIDEAAIAAAREGGQAAINALIYEGARSSETPSAGSRIEDIFAAQTKATQIEIVRSAWLSNNETLTTLAQRHAEDLDPADYTKGRALSGAPNVHIPHDSDSVWLALRRVCQPSRSSRRMLALTYEGNVLSVSARYVSVEYNQDFWDRLRRTSSRLAGWQYIRAVGELVCSGTSVELASALRAVAEIDASKRPPILVPWVLNSLLNTASLRSTTNHSTLKDELLILARDAEMGEYGDRQRWAEQERNASSQGIVRIDEAAQRAIDSNNDPESLPLTGLMFAGHGRDVEEDVEIGIYAGQGLLELANGRKEAVEAPYLAHLALFFVSLHLRRRRKVEGTISAQLLDQLKRSTYFLADSSFSVRWTDWVSSLSKRQLLEVGRDGTGEIIGTTKNSFIRQDENLAAVLLDQSMLYGASYGSLWLAARLDPVSLKRAAVIAVELTPANSFEHRVAGIFSICATEPADLISGTADSLLEELTKAVQEVDEYHLASVLSEHARRTKDRAFAAALCSRVYVVARSKNLRLARQFAGVLERRSNWDESEEAD
jgi:hypothetical protein